MTLLLNGACQPQRLGFPKQADQASTHATAGSRHNDLDHAVALGAGLFSQVSKPFRINSNPLQRFPFSRLSF